MPGRILAVRRVWVSVGIALLALALIESVVRVAFVLRDRSRPAADAVYEERIVSANPGQNWVGGYLRELNAIPEDWHSYIYWRNRPYHGQSINVDEKGIRRTWNRLVSPSSNQLKIFTFGGSTMWGYGARDDFTIPSLISKKLNSQLADSVWVVNFGESGYVSTQEVISLILELRRGNVPDIAVFYDGVNDSLAAFQSGVAGIPLDEFNRVAEFNLRNRLNWRRGFVRKLALSRLSREILGSLEVSPFEVPVRRSVLPPTLANDAVDTYLGNVRLVNALAREYGFRVVFFWQPTIYAKENLSEAEQRWYGRSREKVARDAPLFAEVYRAIDAAFRQKLKAGKFENVYDLSELFANDVRTIFFDRYHVSEVGNDKVADAIAQTLRQVAQGLRR